MNKIKEFIYEEDGLGVVEIILIVVVIIGLVILFQSSMKDVIDSIFDTINEKKDAIE